MEAGGAVAECPGLSGDQATAVGLEQPGDRLMPWDKPSVCTEGLDSLEAGTPTTAEM